MIVPLSLSGWRLRLNSEAIQLPLSLSGWRSRPHSETIQRRACVTASTSIVKLEVET